MKLKKYVMQAVAIFLFCIVLIIQVTGHEPEYTVLEKNDELVSMGNLVVEPFLKEYKMKAEQVAAMEAEAEQILIADSKEGNRMMRMNRVPAMPDHMEDVLIYDDFWDFHDESALPFVSEKVFAKIKAAYDEIEYQGEFEKGDTATYDFYKEKYYLLVENEETFFDKEKEQEYLMKDCGIDFIHYNDIGNRDYDAKAFQYSFFDMDGDGAPELAIQELGGGTDIFKYEKEEDRFVLWGSWWYIPGGTGKIISYDFLHMCIKYGFYQLDEEGNIECRTFFCFTPIRENVTVNLVALPDYADDSKELEVTEDMKKQGMYERSTGHWYFRMNEKQFQKLEERYLKAYEQAEEKLKEVTFTYEELFGGIP